MWPTARYNFLVLTMQCINFCFSSETTPGNSIPGEGVSASREPALGKAFLTLLSRTDLYKRLWEWCVEIFTQVEAVIHTSGITQYSLQCFQKVMPNNMENICIPRDKIEIIAGVRSLQQILRPFPRQWCLSFNWHLDLSLSVQVLFSNTKQSWKQTKKNTILYFRCFQPF